LNPGAFRFDATSSPRVKISHETTSLLLPEQTDQAECSNVDKLSVQTADTMGLSGQTQRLDPTSIHADGAKKGADKPVPPEADFTEVVSSVGRAEYAKRSRTRSVSLHRTGGEDTGRLSHLDHPGANFVTASTEHISAEQADTADCPHALDAPKQPIETGVLSNDSPADPSKGRRAVEQNRAGDFRPPHGVSPTLLARFNREELYERAWMTPLKEIAQDYGVCDVTIGRVCRKLNIPIPIPGYWHSRAANKPVPPKPPLPDALDPIGQSDLAEPPETGSAQESFAVSRKLLARYNREELYEKVWKMPLRKVAEEYGMSHSAMCDTCKRLHIPAPGIGFWSKKAANKPLPVRPRLPDAVDPIRENGPVEAVSRSPVNRIEQSKCSQKLDGSLDHAGKRELVRPLPQDGAGNECVAETNSTDTSQEPFAVSGILLARYDREELYEKMWTMSVRQVAKEYGLCHSVMGKVCKGLHIPVPPVGYRPRKAANRPVPARPRLPEVCSRKGQIEGTELIGTDTSRGPVAVSPRLLAQYDREELYTRVWKMPIWRVAEEYGVSRNGMIDTCKRLNIPAPGIGYWSKRAAGKPVPGKPPLPAVLGLIGQIGLSETKGNDTVHEPLTISAGLMSRYNREELYELVWREPMQKVAKEYGVSDVAIGKTCRKLYIPVPIQGFWNKLAVGKPVRPRPPLPVVQIR
jgi:hypothetical protein